MGAKPPETQKKKFERNCELTMLSIENGASIKAAAVLIGMAETELKNAENTKRLNDVKKTLRPLIKELKTSIKNAIFLNHAMLEADSEMFISLDNLFKVYDMQAKIDGLVKRYGIKVNQEAEADFNQD